MAVSNAPCLADNTATEIPASPAATKSQNTAPGLEGVKANVDSLAHKPVLDPEKYFGKAKAGYEAAKEAPEVCAKLFCYCGCDLTDEHVSLLDCFTSDHGVDCYICQEEALVAAKMHKQGKSLAEIQKVVDLAYRKEYPFEDKSQAFKKYQAAKLWKDSAGASLGKAGSQGGASSVTGKNGGTVGDAKGLKSPTSVGNAKRLTKGSCCGSSSTAHQ